MNSFKKFILESSKTWCAVVLDEESKEKLVSIFDKVIPSGWTIFCNHMTIDENLPLRKQEDLGKKVELTLMSLAYNKEYLAVKVTGYDRQDGDSFAHITIAEIPKELESPERLPLTFKPINQHIKVYGYVENVTEGRRFL